MLTQTFLDIAESIGDQNDGLSPAAARKRWAKDVRIMRTVEGVARMLDAADGSMSARATFYEALSSNDLVAFATGVLIDRQIERGYTEIEKQWPKFFTHTTVRNFKPKSIAELHLGAQSFYDIPTLTPYPFLEGGGLSEYFIQVGKTGARYGWSFESRLKGDLVQLMEVVRAFPAMAANTEDEKSLGLLINLGTGAPATSFFNVGNANLGQMKLGRESLLRVLRYLSTKRDPYTGGLIPTGTLQLVVGPALEGLANAVMGAGRVVITRVDGTKVETDNPIAGRFDVVVNAKQVGASWMVMPKPGTAAKAPTWFAHLTGYESPDYRYANNQGKAMGGGDLGADEGSFLNDSIEYRARHICGAATGDPSLTYASDNTGGATEPANMPTVADVTYTV